MFIYHSSGDPGGDPITHMSCLSVYLRGSRKCISCLVCLMGSRRGWGFQCIASSHTSKLNQSCSTAVVTVFLSSSGLGGDEGGARGSIQGGHWIMVYEYGYEKRKDRRTE